jgi:hypothetical protein
MLSPAARPARLKPLATTAGQFLVLCLALVLLFVPFRSPFNYYDEGFAVFNAVRVIQQDVPYKDFWAIYPPGQPYTLAAIFKSFGVSLLVSRIYDTLVRFAIVLGVYFLAKKNAAPGQALIVCVITALLLASVGTYAYAVNPALALSIWGIRGALEYAVLNPGTGTGSYRWLFLAGLLTGLACFYRWDIGLCAGLSLTVSVFSFHFFNGGLEAQESPGGRRALLAGWTMCLLVPVVMFGVMLVSYYLVSLNSGLDPLWRQVVVFPVTKLVEVRWRAYPALLPPGLAEVSDLWNYNAGLLNWAWFYLPIISYGLTLTRYARVLIVGRMAMDRRHFGTLAAALFGFLLFALALTRYDFTHALPTALLISPVVVSMFSQLVPPGGHANKVIKALLSTLLPVMILAYVAAPLRSVLSTLTQFPPWVCYSRLERASCVYTGENREWAVEYIRAHTRPGEPIFVGNQRHDRVFINEVGVYFLADRPSVTRYSELHPGIVTTLSVQKEIAGELDAKGVSLLVLVDIRNSNEPNDSAVSGGVYYLDNFIRSRYILAAEFGEYEIWSRVTPVVSRGR